MFYDVMLVFFGGYCQLVDWLGRKMLTRSGSYVAPLYCRWWALKKSWNTWNHTFDAIDIEKSIEKILKICGFDFWHFRCPQPVLYEILAVAVSCQCFMGLAYSSLLVVAINSTFYFTATSFFVIQQTQELSIINYIHQCFSFHTSTKNLG